MHAKLAGFLGGLRLGSFFRIHKSVSSNFTYLTPFSIPLPPFCNSCPSRWVPEPSSRREARGEAEAAAAGDGGSGARGEGGGGGAGREVQSRIWRG